MLKMAHAVIGRIPHRKNKIPCWVALLIKTTRILILLKNIKNYQIVEKEEEGHLNDIKNQDEALQMIMKQ